MDFLAGRSIMKVCKIGELHGGEILAKAVMTPEYKVLLSDGTVLKKEYIEKLEELGILEVCIRKNGNKEEKKDSNRDDKINAKINLLEKSLEKEVSRKVQNILEKHIYSKNEELSKLCSTADDIINILLNEKEIAEKVYEIREGSYDIYEHSITICALSVLTALRMGLDERKIKDIGIACLLHDLGIRYIIVDYTDRDIEGMTETKASEYKKHPVYGYSDLKDEPWISDLSKKIILYHHECRNGSGFPMRSQDFPLEAEIVCVCEVFDEMICGIGHEKRKVHEAIRYLKQNRNILYDCKVVDTFLKFMAVYPAGTYVKTNEGEIGIVTEQNNHFPDRPFIKIILDRKGDRVWQDISKDLSMEKNIFIEEVVEMIE